MSHLDSRLVPGTVLPYVETCGHRATARITAEKICLLPQPSTFLPKSYCFKENGARGTISSSRISHRCGVCSAPRSVFKNWNHNSGNKKKTRRERRVFTGFAVNSSCMFSCRFVCARECVDFLDFQTWAQHARAISCPTALFYYAVPPLFWRRVT